MRIGVVGDTHDRIDHVGKIVNLFRQANVERVVHTGDITRPAVLKEFAELDVPIVGVFGNNDTAARLGLEEEAARLGMDFVIPPRTLSWAGREILVVHDPEETSPDPLLPVDLLLHGHTHRYRLEYAGQTLIFNPGECAGFLTGHNSVGLVDLASLETQRLRF